MATLLHTNPIIGKQATKTEIIRQITEVKLVHLATHGLLNEIKSLRMPGAIALSPSASDNGFLTTEDILKLKLQADLVVLSACRSGQGDITGDGVVGLSRSLTAAGISSIVVSLWAVNDLSTAFLMVKFYQMLLQGLSPAVALNKAQRWLLNSTQQELMNWFKENLIVLCLPTLRIHIQRLLKSQSDMKTMVLQYLLC
ncbi:MAG: CHAT domain-containing protein [Scytonema sp. PMC 1070.18]|nr:CHAT domain-containing protein [Scytonema sp. PMC 1070.18]